MPREATIVPYRDGPLLIRGLFVLRDQNGAAIDTRRPTVALCRCGKSRTRPFCDGTHQLIRFTAPSEPEDRVGPVAERNGSAVASRTAEAKAPRPASSANGRPPPRQSQGGALQVADRALARARRSLDTLLSDRPEPVDSRRQLIAELRALADGLEDVGQAGGRTEEGG